MRDEPPEASRHIDIAFATELLNTALQQQSKSCLSEDIEKEQDGGNTADGENTADTTDPDKSSLTGEYSEAIYYYVITFFSVIASVIAFINNYYYILFLSYSSCL
ncbi:hypothetical protein JTB14_011740 [Gonioctena quinquepunctata]|nr:hypothetical protein JTB14_011740 [Gonioctena quinquepunctata]